MYAMRGSSVQSRVHLRTYVHAEWLGKFVFSSFNSCPNSILLFWRVIHVVCLPACEVHFAKGTLFVVTPLPYRIAVGNRASARALKVDLPECLRVPAQKKSCRLRGKLEQPLFS